MRSGALVAIVLASGAAAGLVQGAVSLAVAGPYIDEAVAIEGRRAIAAGLESDTPEFWAAQEAYREWQRQGQVLAAVVLGTSVGSLFGIVYALARGSLPGGHDVKRALALAGVMWLVLFMVPFLKYPASPPGAGDGGDVGARGAAFVAFTAVSGLSAAGLWLAARRLRGAARLAAPAAGYAAVMAAAAALMPAGPDSSALPEQLVAGFRAASVAGTSAFWVAAPVALGLLWHRFRPDARVRRAAE